MASYHFAVQVIKRADGRSTVKAAAYRSGTRLTDRRTGETADFSRRRGVVFQEVMLPEGAAPWLADREQLWNHVEALERRKDAQLAREINLALPHELTSEERRAMVRAFVRDTFVREGMVADIALHDPVPERGDDPRNFHAHIMLTLRQATPSGLRRVKTREWNSRELLVEWRARWGHFQNRVLESRRHAARVDHRRLEVQRQDALKRGDRVAAAGLARAPEIHVGPQARAAGRRGWQPASRPRERPTARPVGGGWVSSARPEKRQRIVNYQAIDRGSRSAWNAGLVEANLARTFHRADRLERLAVRLRQREMRALRTIAARGAPPARPGKAVPRPADETRLAIARRQAQRSRGLLAEIERLLAEMFHVRDLWGERHRDLVRLPRWSEGRPFGRGRGRSWP